jgi:phosphatidylserine/phosphatidylglycerophosphate/cardiolipin synthase-like enzyme
MTKKTRSSRGNGLGTLIVLVFVVIAGALYSLMGSNPLGLSAQDATSTPFLPPVTETTVASVTESIPTLESLPAAGETPAETAPTTEPATGLPPATLEPTSLPASSWWKVFFVTPIRVRQADEEAYGTYGIPPEILQGSIAEQLIQRINNASKTIHIASFETDVIDVAKALILAKKRGVDVRWITDDEYGIDKDGEPGHGQFKLMQDAGIEIKDDARGGLMHNKFWIFDGQTTWTGSTNITVSGLFEQNNNTIVIESPELAAIYERQFADMWSGQFGARSPSTVAQQKLNVNGTDIQVLFSPEDKAIENILPYIQKAQKSIYFMAFTFTQPQLGEAMVTKAQAGVTVSGVFETTGSETEYSELTPMYCNKIPVRQDGNFAFMHSKTIIVDERYVITGSLNFTDNANKSNNENVIILDNPEIARLYMEEFQRVWAVATDPDPAKIICKK